MLFAGIKKATQEMEQQKKKQEQEKDEIAIIILDDDSDEREDMQEKTFRKWVNLYLENTSQGPISDLFKDFCDGTRLLALLEILTGQKLPREKGRMRVHGINNLNRAIQFLQDQKVKLVNINSNDLADGNPKITLGLVWHIIQHSWQIFANNEHLSFKEMTLNDVLMRWCHYSVSNYPGIKISNFTTSWQDGLAFNALLHNYMPEVFDFQEAIQMDTPNRLAHAFDIAHKHLKVQKILDPEDVIGDDLDKKSVMTYLLLLFKVLPHDTLASEESMKSFNSAPLTLTPSTPSLQDPSASLQEYRLCLEEVLTWLLDAEERLSQFETVSKSEDVEIVKAQFKAHEDFMMSLTQSQGGVGDALHSGQILLDSGGLSPSQTEEVKKEMGLVNEKWEKLREGAMERQAILQEKLMRLQQKQLDSMKEWLNEKEEHINSSPPIPTDPHLVTEETNRHKEFQSSIEQQEKVVSSLATFVAVMDESNQSEENYFKLESILQDIGKRWAGVCQWAEKRSERLDGLGEDVENLLKEQKHFQDWLDQRETALSSLRSAHHLTTSKDVLEQVQNLQSMEQDLESEHPRFVRLSQLSSKVTGKLEWDNPIGGSEVRRKLEAITQRWDNLVVRMEEHSKILVKSGKVSSPNLLQMLPQVGAKKRKLKGPTQQQKVRVTAVQYSETSSTRPKHESVTEKLKTEGRSGEYDDLLRSFIEWLDKAEAHLSLSPSSSNFTEGRVSLKEIENEIPRKSEDLECLHDAAHQVLESKQSDEKVSGKIESEMHGIGSRWRDIQLALKERQRQEDALKEADHFQQELIQIDRAILELSDWVDNFKPETLTEVTDIRGALRQCQEKLELVKQKEPEIEEMQRRLEELTEVGGKEVEGAQRDFERFTGRWEKVVEKISGALETLSASLEKAPEPTLIEAIQALQEWLNTTEEVLKTENLEKIDHLDITQAKIDKLKELEAQRVVHADSIQFLNRASEDPDAEASGLSLQNLESINQRWEELEKKVKDLQERLEIGLARLREWDKCATELDGWLDQVTEFLHAEQPAHGDIPALKEQLEQSQGLMTDMAQLKPKLGQMNMCVQNLAEQAAPALADYLTHRMEEVDRRWDDVERLSKAKNDSLQDAFTRSHKVFDDILQLSKFLSKIDGELSSSGPPTTGKELQSLIKRHKQIREELEGRSKTVESAVELAEELAASLEGSPEAASSFRSQMKATRQQWEAICKHVNTRITALDESFELWKEFQGLLASEKVNLDELEKKVGEPISNAADAEEFSEQLDVLERLMEGGENGKRLENIAQELTNRGILVPAVQTELGKYKNRREEILEPAKNRQVELERGVSESQEFEEQLLSCQSWASHVDIILSSRLDSDIYASEVPEEFKQLQVEFEEHENCLEKLKYQVETYRNQNREEAAQRLQEQLQHVQRTIGDLRAKFSNFKRPRDFEQRLDRASRILSDVEQGIGLLKPSGTCLADIDTQVERCQEIKSGLQDVSKEVDYVMGAGNKLLEEGILEKTSNIVLRFNALKPDHWKLTKELERCENTLKEARIVMEKYEKEQRELVSFLSNLELSLEKWESSQPSERISTDMQYLNRIKEELPRKEGQFAVMEDELRKWKLIATPHSHQSLTLKFDSFKLRRKDFCRKLEKWEESLKNMEKDNESLMLEFEVLHREVKNWLEESEPKIKQLQIKSQNNDKEETYEEKIKSLILEAGEVRPKMDHLRDKAVELMRRGEVPQHKLEEPLTQLNTRWETAMTHMRDLEGDGGNEVPSRMLPLTRLEIMESEFPPTIIVTSPTTNSLSSSLSTESRTSSRLQRVEPIREDSPLTPPGTPQESTGLPSGLEKEIESATLALCRIEKMIDFDRLPPQTIPEWANRTKEARFALDEMKKPLHQILNEGQLLADSGPMELHTQQTLERIDQINNVAKNLESELEVQSKNVGALMNEYEKYKTEVERMETWINTIKQKNLQDPIVLIEAENEMKSREEEFTRLRMKGKNFQTHLPSVSSGSEEEVGVRMKMTQIPSEPVTLQMEEKWGELEKKLRTISTPIISSPIKSVTVHQTEIVPDQMEEREEKQSGFSPLESEGTIKSIVDGVEMLDGVMADMENRISKQQSSSLGKFGNFADQEKALLAMDENLKAVEGMLNQLKENENNLSEAGALPSEKDRLKLHLTSLQTRLSRMKEAQSEKTIDFKNRLSMWQGFQRDIHNLSDSIHKKEDILVDWRNKNGSVDLITMENLQTNLEKDMEGDKREVEKIWMKAQQILPHLNLPDASVLEQTLQAISERWKKLSDDVCIRRQRLEERQAEDTELRDELDELLFWCDETEALLQTQVDPSNKAGLHDLLQRFKEHIHDYPEQQLRLKMAEKAKDRYIDLKLVPTEQKHQVRRDVADLTSKLIKMKPRLEKGVKVLDERVKDSTRFWKDLDSLMAWLRKAKSLLNDYQSAVIFTPTKFDPREMEKDLKKKEAEKKDLMMQFDKLKKLAELESEDKNLDEKTQREMREMLKLWDEVQDSLLSIRTSSSSSISEPTTVEPDEFMKEEEKMYTPLLKKSRPTSLKVKEDDKDIQGRDNQKAAKYARIDSGKIEMVPIEPDKLPSDPKSAAQMRELIHLRHWLADTANEANSQVNLIHIQGIRDAIKAQQAVLDQYHTKRLELIRILEDSSHNQEVQHKAELLSHEWERMVSTGNRRKKTLNRLMDEARHWDSLRSELEIWLNEGNRRTTAGPKVTECTLDTLKRELSTIEGLFACLNDYKSRMTELNRMGNGLLDSYPNDDATALSQTMSELNTQWSKFNDNVRIRKAVLEASLRSRKDFQTALKEFEEWMGRLEVGLGQLDLETDNSQLIKDTQQRKSWMDTEKELRMEMEAHEDVLSSLQEVGGKLASSMEDAPGEENSKELNVRIERLNGRWQDMLFTANKLRSRLEAAQEEWERLTKNLKELIFWIEEKEREILNEQPVGGDLTRVKEQSINVNNVKNEMEGKSEGVKETLKLAHGFLIQQDLRPPLPLHSPTHSDEENENTVSLEKSGRRIAEQIRNECQTLEEKWKELQDKAEKWKKIVEDALTKMIGFDKAVGSCEESLRQAERTRRLWKPVKEIQLEELPIQMAKTKDFRRQLQGVRRFVDDVNDHSSRLMADNIKLSQDATDTLEGINNRYKQLETSVNQRVVAMERAVEDFGPSSQHFLSNSVQLPWERRISQNIVPYFLDHETERTQWDHPFMVKIMKELCEFNEIKFSAYRTATKLRALQKRLFLDLITLEELDATFMAQNIQSVNDRVLDTSEIIMTLLPLYERVQANWSQLLKSLSAAIDLCLNWLLNLYDSSRSGTMRVLSFKVALVLLCSAHLEDKYKYLFNLVSSSGAGVDQKRLALLFYDCIQVPKFLGEVAAFGGSNIEPSVRSCFQQVKFPQEIRVKDFLEWLKEEPQSLVWLPVLHRVAAAEMVKHQAKCNVCKMFPIVGLRYRCLKCFNFDCCQNCFFSQRVAKGHRLNHPMQEYCVASTSGEDVRDFSKVVKNKFKPKNYFKKHPRLGYLPVQSVDEGCPLESQARTLTNSSTQYLHGRVDLLSNRLEAIERNGCGSEDGEKRPEDEHTAIANLSNTLAVPDDPSTSDLGVYSPPIEYRGGPLTAAPLPKSPAQILYQIDHMQKEELDQVMKTLEYQNKTLQAEYERLKNGGNMQGAISTPHLPLTNGSLSRGGTLPQMPHSAGIAGRSMGSLQQHHGDEMSLEMNEEDMLLEARALRQHKQRLEERSRVLEDHNKQLAVQLMRLKHLIDEQRGSSQLNDRTTMNESMTSMGGGMNGSLSGGFPTPLISPHSTLQRSFHLHHTLPDDTDSSAPDQAGARMGSLMSTAQDLGRAMETLVTAVTSDDELSGDEG